MNEKVKEIENLLTQSEELIKQGKLQEATVKISEAKEKLRPIGIGTNGPEPKK